MGASYRASPPPLPRPNGGGNHGPVPVHRTLASQLKASFMPHEAINARHWNLHDLCNRDIRPPCIRQQGNLDETLRLDRSVDDLVEEPQMRNVTRGTCRCTNGQTTSEEPARPTGQRHRSPCPRNTGQSLRGWKGVSTTVNNWTCGAPPVSELSGPNCTA